MSRLHDVLYFLRQIFFPNSLNREEDIEPAGLWKLLAWIFLFLTSRNGTGAVFSIILHAFILVILSLIMIPQLGNLTGIDILGDWNIPGIDEPLIIAANESDNGGESQNIVPENLTTEPVTPIPVEQPAQTAEEVTTTTPLPDPFSTEQWKIRAMGGFASGGGFQNRTPEGRQGAMRGGGGSCQRGEDAVEAALEWFAHHQQTDGGWSLHFNDSCRHCSRSGTSPTKRRTAATALALLSFLGAGYSHQPGNKYSTVVEEGLLFLIDNRNDGIEGIATQEDALRMYSHGLAAIALCEAYAMNPVQDPTSWLGRAAQRSLELIETAQDTEHGGWNYRPFQMTRQLNGIETRVGGDTSIFAWQLMALKSGRLGGLHVSQSVLYAAQDFLDSVALEGGRRYLYLPTGDWDATIRGEDSPQTCTAMGLLMRMYLGWKPGDPFLDDGIDQIAQWGYILREGECNLYYAYYATLALHHYGGKHWDSWNTGLRDMLIRTQVRDESCESGSWYFHDPYCNVGGRLLNTALATMILETPYRIMPLYREIR